MVKKTNSLTSNVAADVNLSVGVARVFYATRKCTQPFAPRSMRLDHAGRRAENATTHLSAQLYPSSGLNSTPAFLLGTHPARSAFRAPEVYFIRSGRDKMISEICLEGLGFLSLVPYWFFADFTANNVPNGIGLGIYILLVSNQHLAALPQILYRIWPKSTTMPEPRKRHTEDRSDNVLTNRI
jgi:hypothetical protein